MNIFDKLNFINLKQQLHNYVITIAEKYIAADTILDNGMRKILSVNKRAHFNCYNYKFIRY